MQTNHYKNDFKNDIHYYFFADISFAFIYFETLARRYAILQDIYYEKFHKNVAQQRSRQQVTASKNKSPKACQEGKKMDINGHFSENHASGHIRKSRVSPILVGWKHAEAKGHSIPIVRNNHRGDFHRIISHLLRFSSIVCTYYYQSVIIFLPIQLNLVVWLLSYAGTLFVNY